MTSPSICLGCGSGTATRRSPSLRAAACCRPRRCSSRSTPPASLPRRDAACLAACLPRPGRPASRTHSSSITTPRTRRARPLTSTSPPSPLKWRRRRGALGRWCCSPIRTARSLHTVSRAPSARACASCLWWRAGRRMGLSRCCCRRCGAFARRASLWRCPGRRSSAGSSRRTGRARSRRTPARPRRLGLRPSQRRWASRVSCTARQSPSALRRTSSPRSAAWSHPRRRRSPSRSSRSPRRARRPPERRAPRCAVGRA
mmetsp:Transcript_16435/g.48839  ORF Transcript_16435/g.48839 Transcript_16435/m.48839 type:complete len:258 (-) Transcript_16435:199-972(-)